jgi:hypothetical protein
MAEILLAQLLMVSVSGSILGLLHLRFKQLDKKFGGKK